MIKQQENGRSRKGTIPKNNPYNSEIPGLEALQRIPSDEITKQLNNYLGNFNDCSVRSQQIRCFENFTKGSLGSLDRKSIGPIALPFLGGTAVRGMQGFSTRPKGWGESLSAHYKEELARALGSPQGF